MVDPSTKDTTMERTAWYCSFISNGQVGGQSKKEKGRNNLAALIGGKQTGCNNSRSHQQAAAASTIAQRIQPRKGRHCCIAASLPRGKLNGGSRRTERSEQEGRQKQPGIRTDQAGIERPESPNCDTVHQPAQHPSRPPRTPTSFVLWWQFPNGSPPDPLYSHCVRNRHFSHAVGWLS